MRVRTREALCLRCKICGDILHESQVNVRVFLAVMTEVSAHLLSVSYQVGDKKQQQHKGTRKTQRLTEM